MLLDLIGSGDGRFVLLTIALIPKHSGISKDFYLMLLNADAVGTRNRNSEDFYESQVVDPCFKELYFFSSLLPKNHFRPLRARPSQKILKIKSSKILGWSGGWNLDCS